MKQKKCCTNCACGTHCLDNGCECQCGCECCFTLEKGCENSCN